MVFASIPLEHFFFHRFFCFSSLFPTPSSIFSWKGGRERRKEFGKLLEIKIPFASRCTYIYFTKHTLPHPHTCFPLGTLAPQNPDPSCNSAAVYHPHDLKAKGTSSSHTCKFWPRVQKCSRKVVSCSHSKWIQITMLLPPPIAVCHIASFLHGCSCPPKRAALGRIPFQLLQLWKGFCSSEGIC